jgi:hypothetical protein
MTRLNKVVWFYFFALNFANDRNESVIHDLIKLVKIDMTTLARLYYTNILTK